MNPCCPYVGCKGFLHRKHSGRGNDLVCSLDKGHRVSVSPASPVIVRDSLAEGLLHV